MVHPAQVTPPATSRLGDPLSRRNAPSATSIKTSVCSKKGAVNGGMMALGTIRRRPLRKDRHSKIFTARGPRDRRMRLSLDVARKFFDLQDILGFDKASKTVDWLLTNATSSIKELTSCSSPTPYVPGKSDSSTSECEVISTDATRLAAGTEENAAVPPFKGSKKVATHPTLSRESRVLARARARERTREKLGLKGADRIGQKKLAADEKLSGGSSGRSSELMGEEQEQQWKDSGDSQRLVVPMASVPVPVFDYHGNIISEAIGFVQEHWSMYPSGNTEEQRVLLPDAQLMPWFWDPFSNTSI